MAASVLRQVLCSLYFCSGRDSLVMTEKMPDGSYEIKNPVANNMFGLHIASNTLVCCFGFRAWQLVIFAHVSNSMTGAVVIIRSS